MRKTIVLFKGKFLGTFTTFSGEVFNLYLKEIIQGEGGYSTYKRLFFKENGLFPIESIVDISSIDFSKSTEQECSRFLDVFEGNSDLIINNPSLKDSMLISLLGSGKNSWLTHRRCYHDNYRDTIDTNEKKYLINIIKERSLHSKVICLSLIDYNVKRPVMYSPFHNCNSNLLDIYVIYNPYITKEQITKNIDNIKDSINRFFLDTNILLREDNKVPFFKTNLNKEFKIKVVKETKEEKVAKLNEYTQGVKIKIQEINDKINAFDLEYKNADLVRKLSIQKEVEPLINKKVNYEKSISLDQEEIEKVNKRFDFFLQQIGTL